MYAQVRELPNAIQTLLASLGYGSKDILVETGTEVSPLGPGGDGLREFCAILDLSTGERKVEWGSWGGANMFNPRNRVDLDGNLYPIPPNSCVVKGHTGGGRPVYATLTVRPDMVLPCLPSKVGLNPRLQWILDTLKRYNSGGRKYEFHRWEHVPPSDGEFKELETLGLIKITKSGAISVTTAGKNAVTPGFGSPVYAPPWGNHVQYRTWSGVSSHA
jgi:hypothetical protein